MATHKPEKKPEPKEEPEAPVKKGDGAKRVLEAARRYKA